MGYLNSGPKRSSPGGVRCCSGCPQATLPGTVSFPGKGADIVPAWGFSRDFTPHHPRICPVGEILTSADSCPFRNDVLTVSAFVKVLKNGTIYWRMTITSWSDLTFISKCAI